MIYYIVPNKYTFKLILVKLIKLGYYSRYIFEKEIYDKFIILISTDYNYFDSFKISNVNTHLLNMQKINLIDLYTQKFLIKERMKKFNRLNRHTSEMEEMFSTGGVIKSINESPKENTNGNKFYNFTALIDMTRGPIICLGQVYENSFEYLGGKPKQGDRFAFITKIKSLKEKNNKVWSIAGFNIDEIDEDLLEDIDSM